MKKFTIFLMLGLLVLTAISQDRPYVSNDIRLVAFEGIPGISYVDPLRMDTVEDPANIDLWTEESIGETTFDLQSNYGSQNRIYFYDDGTIGATWTMGFTVAGNFPDRGTGYNYFNGTGWQEYPEERIESQRCGWPSYFKYGANGEMIVSHTGQLPGLALNYRTTKGSGEWTEMFYPGPAGYEDLIWPRAVSAGADNLTLHIFAVTTPVDNGGALYQGMDGAMLYSRSLDGGMTWIDNNVLLDGMGPDYYNHCGGDYCAIAEPVGDNIAFLMVSKWHDMYLMKSEDNGATWTKTMIWEHPYPFFDWEVTVTDTFYCPDGAAAVALDIDGNAHITFGITRVGHFDVGNTYTGFFLYDGLGYWREGMEPFEDGDMNLNALDPLLLEENVNLIGWSPDLNGNGEWDIIGEQGSLGNYRTGISTMPTMTIDENNYIYVVYSSLAETFQTETQNYRHLFARTSKDGGDTWVDDIYDITGDIAHVFSECIHPSMAYNTDEYIHLIYHEDTEPGQAVQGDLDPYGNNTVPYIKIMKPEILGINDISPVDRFNPTISQNYPNPANGITQVNVHMMQSANVRLVIHNMMGQEMMAFDQGLLPTGVHTLAFDVSGLPDGVYFYTVIAGEQTATKKMIKGK
ncbi:MAG TPA: T9SS type A sorting domain-containing protein [Bacteroidales bacterium]|nr:T9SS type A sorting domain-containing protein [Bacteroidales bacterium]